MNGLRVGRSSCLNCCYTYAQDIITEPLLHSWVRLMGTTGARKSAGRGRVTQDSYDTIGCCTQAQNGVYDIGAYEDLSSFRFSSGIKFELLIKQWTKNRTDFVWTDVDVCRWCKIFWCVPNFTDPSLPALSSNPHEDASVASTDKKSYRGWRLTCKHLVCHWEYSDTPASSTREMLPLTLSIQFSSGGLILYDCHVKA